ncbi:MAG TPA: hypothetical protein PKX87_00135, partial [Alphaproteobacteria bacterium]|nr:hypothetical protein [Alphaproteobacteria bacterium]
MEKPRPPSASPRPAPPRPDARHRATSHRAKQGWVWKLAGPVVLAAGILSVLGVAWMALPTSPPAPRPDVVSFLEQQRAWEARQPTTDQMATQATQSNLARQMEGLWIARFEEGTAALNVAGGVFQILFYPSVGTIPRRAVRGVLDVKGDIVLLTPREDLGEPAPVIVDGRFFPYQPLTRRTWAVVVKRQGDKLVWEKGPANVSGVHGTPEFHPLFTLAPEGRIVWDPPPPAPASTPQVDAPAAPPPVTDSSKDPSP